MSEVHGNLFAKAGDTTQISATNTTGTLDMTNPRYEGGGSVLISNSGPKVAFFRFGASGVTTTIAQGTPILSAEQKVFSMPPRATHVAVICESGETAEIYFTPGRGL